MHDEALTTVPGKDWLGLAGIILFNLLPIYGVLAWGWTSFELIFLYWFENVIIGAFVMTRMLLRPYATGKDFFRTLFLAAFFTVHFGAFCWAHGTFIFSMFGTEALEQMGVVAASLDLLSNGGLLPAAASLALLQASNWFFEIREQGLGAETPNQLMSRPYRRIVVLHVAIIAAGAALSALDEPIIGLLILVAVKMASDIWHWRRESVTQPPPSRLSE